MVCKDNLWMEEHGFAKSLCPYFTHSKSTNVCDPELFFNAISLFQNEKPCIRHAAFLNKKNNKVCYKVLILT